LIPIIAIVDYGCGNLFSLKNALDYIGAKWVITGNAKEIESADKVILPGVGAFGAAMGMLRQSGLIPALRECAQKKPLLGICVGAQLLFEKGYEFGETDGLGFISGCVRHINAPGLKIPHMGWNEIALTQDDPLTSGLQGEYFYFVHSYRINTQPESIYAKTEYGEEIPAVVGKGFIRGCQFHPEKSGEAGIKLLKHFAI
jgi:glutamine amidotransferase